MGMLVVFNLKGEVMKDLLEWLLMMVFGIVFGIMFWSAFFDVNFVEVISTRMSNVFINLLGSVV